MRNEVEELKILLKAAKRFDEKTGQKDCETGEKIKMIRQVADMFGISMDDVFPKK